jgi:hypothetical protein
MWGGGPQDHALNEPDEQLGSFKLSTGPEVVQEIHEEINGGNMKERTDRDVLMQIGIAAIGQLLTDAQTTQPESAPTPTLDVKKLFRITPWTGRST